MRFQEFKTIIKINSLEKSKINRLLIDLASSKLNLRILKLMSYLDQMINQKAFGITNQIKITLTKKKLNYFIEEFQFFLVTNIIKRHVLIKSRLDSIKTLMLTFNNLAIFSKLEDEFYSLNQKLNIKLIFNKYYLIINLKTMLKIKS